MPTHLANDDDLENILYILDSIYSLNHYIEIG